MRWAFLAQNSVPCHVMQLNQTHCPFDWEIVTLVWVGLQRVALCNESPSCWHPEEPPPPIHLHLHLIPLFWICVGLSHSGLMYLVITGHYHCGRACHGALCSVDPLTQQMGLKAVKWTGGRGAVIKTTTTTKKKPCCFVELLPVSAKPHKMLQ